MPDPQSFDKNPCSYQRATAWDLKRQIALFADGALNRTLLDAVPTPLMVLNTHQQIVYANKGLLDMAAADASEVYGRRPGEVLDCHQSVNTPGGCGTSEACKSCGAILATLCSLGGRQNESECCVSRSREEILPESLELRVNTSPLTIDGETFVIFAVTDISHEKRRRVLERIFFHDILNVAGGIRGFAEYLLQHDPPNPEEIYALIRAAADQTIEEIETQRLLSEAENQELQVRSEPLILGDFLETTVGFYRQHEAARGKHLHLDDRSPELILVSDRTLLRRVLGNAIKNALEACSPGETVTVGSDIVGDQVRFNIHNPGHIPHPVQLRIFQRSFSTKGPGRGLGTYSLRLLGNHMGIQVSFTSSIGKGTLFTILHPLSSATE
ncbi:MAG: ATP-binding protein [Syntrophotaleaceae bacterium]